MTAFWIFFSSVFIVYTGYLVLCAIGWLRSRKDQRGANDQRTSISIIVPVRNEAENIERRIKDLLPEIESMPGAEILIVNDESTDSTGSVLAQWANEERIKLLQVQNGTGKKAAIRTGVFEAQNDLILTTDADVISGKGFVASVVGAIGSASADMLLMPVLIDDSKGMLGQMQLMDQAMLTGLAIGSAEMDLPVWASGAALAFRKKYFLELDGYKGNERWASGDDVFLLHKFNAAGKQIKALNSAASTVFAYPCTSWSELISQRIRWGSKALAYTDHVALFVSLLGVLRWILLFLLAVLVIFSDIYCIPVLLFGLGTFAADLILLNIVLRTTPLKLPWYAQLIVPVFYLFFGLFMILASIIHTPQWKGRKTVGIFR